MKKYLFAFLLIAVQIICYYFSYISFLFKINDFKITVTILDLLVFTDIYLFGVMYLMSEEKSDLMSELNITEQHLEEQNKRVARRNAEIEKGSHLTVILYGLSHKNSDFEYAAHMYVNGRNKIELNDYEMKLVRIPKKEVKTRNYLGAPPWSKLLNRDEIVMVDKIFTY